MRFAGDEKWQVVPRRGDLKPVVLTSKEDTEAIRKYATGAADKFREEFARAARKGFGEEWAKRLEQGPHEFDLPTAKELIAIAETEDAAGGE